MILPAGWALHMRDLPEQHAIELEISSPCSSIFRLVPEALMVSVGQERVDFEVENMIEYIVWDMIEYIVEHEGKRWC